MTDDDYEARLERAAYELYVKKITRKQSHPLLFKLVRALGFKVRLPHYATPRSVFIFCSIYIAILFACLLLFVQRGTEGMSFINIALLSALVGLVFGAIMMAINIENRKKYDLTDWDDL
ncbi:MAG: DUF6404 family protein [Granulosicoccus sp.]